MALALVVLPEQGYPEMVMRDMFVGRRKGRCLSLKMDLSESKSSQSRAKKVEQASRKCNRRVYELIERVQDLVSLSRSTVRVVMRIQLRQSLHN
jgi:hypothetical protein